MIKLKKGKQIALVPSGAVQSFIATGWSLASEVKVKVVQAPVKPQDVSKEDGSANISTKSQKASKDASKASKQASEPVIITDEELMLIPAEEMNKNQVKRAAKILGISIKGRKPADVAGEVAQAIAQANEVPDDIPEKQEEPASE